MNSINEAALHNYIARAMPWIRKKIFDGRVGRIVDLKKLADEVFDEKSLIDFIATLAINRAEEVAKEKVSPSLTYDPGVNRWENSTIETFWKPPLIGERRHLRD